MQAVPAATRGVRIELVLKKLSTVVDNAVAYADNLSLVLTAPEAGLRILALRNTASGVESTRIAPGEMVTLKARGLDAAETARMRLDPDGKVSRQLNGAVVTFITEDGASYAAPLLYVAGAEVSAIVPFEVDGKPKATLVLSYKGSDSPAYPLEVVPVFPGIFTQEGPAGGSRAGQIWNADWTLNSEANQAARGSMVTIFWTGGGQTNPAGVTGRIESGALPRPVRSVEVRIGGSTAELVGVSGVPWSWAGLLMAQAKIPAAAAVGAAPVVIRMDGGASPDNGAVAYVK